jgi:hypothetical protein
MLLGGKRRLANTLYWDSRLICFVSRRTKLYNAVQDGVDWLSSELSAIQDSNANAVIIFGHDFPNHHK